MSELRNELACVLCANPCKGKQDLSTESVPFDCWQHLQQASRLIEHWKGLTLPELRNALACVVCDEATTIHRDCPLRRKPLEGEKCCRIGLKIADRVIAFYSAKYAGWEAIAHNTGFDLGVLSEKKAHANELEQARSEAFKVVGEWLEQQYDSGYRLASRYVIYPHELANLKAGKEPWK